MAHIQVVQDLQYFLTNSESGPGIIAADEVHCLILTGMSGEDVVVLVVENSEPEVIGIRDVYETIVAEKSVRSD